MSPNQHHPLSNDTLVRMIQSGELKLQQPSTTAAALAAKIVELRGFVERSHGKKMPVSAKALEQKLELAEALRRFSVVESASFGGSQRDDAGSRRAGERKRVAFITSLCAVRKAAAAWLAMRGHPTGAFDVITFTKRSAAADSTLKLQVALKNAAGLLDGAPVDDWQKVVADARSLFAAGSTKASAGFAVDAHGAAESLVMDVIRALRLGFWDDAHAQRQLKLRGGAQHKRPKTSDTAPPASSPPTETVVKMIA